MYHDAGLRETYAGEWQGLTNAEIRARYAEEYEAWAQGHPVRRGGGELATEVADRAVPVVLSAVGKLPEDGTLVVVSHGGTIRTMIGRLLELEPVLWERFGVPVVTSNQATIEATLQAAGLTPGPRSELGDGAATLVRASASA